MQWLYRSPALASSLHSLLVIRHCSSQLFIGGLSYDTNETILKKAFGEYGEVIEVKVICDRKSGKSKGYGFVNYTAQTAADKALKEMDGKLLDGWNIRVHYAYRGGTRGNQDATDGTRKSPDDATS